MIKFAEVSPSLRSWAGQTQGNCFHVSRRSRLEIHSAFFTDSDRRNAEDSPYGIQFWYPEYADIAAYGRDNCIRLHTDETQSNCSYLKVYDSFSFRIKTLERGSEQYSL
jgi:hypothetical protein